jgi:ParB-like chromosome segregation protein Spo0J
MNQYQKVKLSEIVPNNYNPKIDFRADVYNRKMYNKVVESLKKHGQIDPNIVRELED